MNRGTHSIEVLFCTRRGKK